MRRKKGFTVLEIIVSISILSVLALVAVPVFFTPSAQKQKASVRANVSIAVSAITGKFSLREEKDKTPKKIAAVVAKNLNKTTKNPIQKNVGAFSVNSVSKGTVVFVPNDDKNLIEIKGYGEDLNKPLETKTVYGFDD